MKGANRKGVAKEKAIGKEVTTHFGAHSEGIRKKPNKETQSEAVPFIGHRQIPPHYCDPTTASRYRTSFHIHFASLKTHSFRCFKSVPYSLSHSAISHLPIKKGEYYKGFWDLSNPAVAAPKCAFYTVIPVICFFGFFFPPGGGVVVDFSLLD